MCINYISSGDVETGVLMLRIDGEDTDKSLISRDFWDTAHYRAILEIPFFDALTTVLTIGEREGRD